jgi:DNA-3-methyladenine glycosylase
LHSGQENEWSDAAALGGVTAGSALLDESFYARPTIVVAHELLGKVIVHGRTAGRIVEVEAYLGTEDLAAHAAAGLTNRTRVLFGPPGRAYVYLSYGIHECLNFVAEPDGVPGCVLIRALEPLSGVALMRRRRPAAKRRRDLCSGPGKLTAAMNITRALNGANVSVPGDFVVRAPSAAEPFKMGTSTRIGITKCAGWPLRFFVRDNPYVSG